MDEVKKSYYKLVKKYHPDLNKDNPDAEEQFKSIVKAYETLIDPNKRQIHDLSHNNSNFNNAFDEEGAY
jgi:molecular chaperone DnaJ